jgi:hypothetical protein
MKRLVSLSLLIAFRAFGAGAFYTYVGQLGPRSVLLAWGTADGLNGKNTIGRDSQPTGKAVVRIAGRTLPADRNWLEVDGLEPDTAYPYEVDIDGQRRGGGQVRTWAEHADHFCFFVIGDYGNGLDGQMKVAATLAAEFQKHAAGSCPVRFVLTVGDNIYADANLGLGVSVHSGDQDEHWDRKFFRPYAEVLRQVPFLATLGNHDGNGSENRGDLFTYLDNFFFPENQPARWYTFTYGGFAQFFALDSTVNSEIGPAEPVWLPTGPQTLWLQQTFADSTAAWKIPYFHHPIYNAGPRHPASLNDLRAWVNLFQSSGVRAVFTGHEHNFQFTDAAQTGGILYVISGSGGELRPGDVRHKMNAQHIAGWTATRLFLSVEIEGSTMRVNLVSPDAFQVVDSKGHAVKLPVVQTLK